MEWMSAVMKTGSNFVDFRYPLQQTSKLFAIPQAITKEIV
jgi:hypothetical protein